MSNTSNAIRTLLSSDFTGAKNPAATLYRHIIRHVPRVLTLYDLNHMEPKEARKAIQNLFRENADVRDPRVIDMMITKANMELNETLMQWKQKTHLATLLEGALPDPKHKNMDEADLILERFFANAETEQDEDVFTYYQ